MKKEYLQTICNKLNNEGFTEFNSEDILSSDRQPFSVGTGLIRTLAWLPEENLKKMSEYDISRFKQYNEVYQAWGREGFFKFKPYVISKDNTTMCLRHNKFLHMFRGYHFQISDTPDGIGQCETGLMRTDGFINLLSYEKVASKSHLGFIILYAAMIDCAFHNDNFRDLFYNNREEIDAYFCDSMKFWHINFNYGFDIIKQYMSYREGNLITSECGHQVYSISGKGGVFCRFWESSDKVEVEYCCDKDNGVGSSKIISFTIPSPLYGIDDKKLELWDDSDKEDLENSFVEACYSREKIQYFILLMLLKFVGISSNFMCTYPIKKIGFIRKVEDADAIEINKFDQIIF